MSKTLKDSGKSETTENPTNNENENGEEDKGRKSSVSKQERLRKVQQKIKMRIGVWKMHDVMKNIKSGD